MIYISVMDSKGDYFQASSTSEFMIMVCVIVWCLARYEMQCKRTNTWLPHYFRSLRDIHSTFEGISLVEVPQMVSCLVMIGHYTSRMVHVTRGAWNTLSLLLEYAVMTLVNWDFHGRKPIFTLFHRVSYGYIFVCTHTRTLKRINFNTNMLWGHKLW